MPRKFFGRLLPTPETLRSQKSLRWLGPLLHRPWLWHFNRRTVAAGAGIGVFFGFLVPILQIALAAVFAILLRANLPVAALSTLVSNPFTYAPIGVAAYRVGAAVLGEPASQLDEAVIQEEVEHAKVTEVVEPRWWERFAGVGKQIMVGLAIFAVLGGLGAYFATHLAWRIAVFLRQRRRRARPPRR
jgi:uncharacterized protein